MYQKQTNSIAITAVPEFDDNKSSLNRSFYVWTYHIFIENKGKNSVQLLNRHWKIIDASGQIKEVIGAGVVGLQPVLAPGECFEYASEASLTTSSGMMFGTYEMVNNEGRVFTVEIPAFSLDCPHVKEAMN